MGVKTMIELKVYEAFDGKQFEDMAECMEYEQEHRDEIFNENCMCIAMVNDGTYYIRIGGNEVYHVDDFDELTEWIYEYHEEEDPQGMDISGEEKRKRARQNKW